MSTLKTFVSRATALASQAEGLASSAVELLGQVPQAHLMSSRPRVGNEKSELFHLPYVTNGEIIPLELLTVDPINYPSADRQKVYALPSVQLVPGVTLTSHTPYGKFEGAAWWIHLDLVGIHEVGGVELSLGEEVVVLAIETADRTYSRYLNIRGRDLGIAVPKIQTSRVSLLVLSETYCASAAGFLITILAARARRWQGAVQQPSRFRITSPHPIVSLTTGHVEEHDSAVRHTLTTDAQTLTGISGLPNLMISTQLPGWSSHVLRPGSYTVFSYHDFLPRKDMTNTPSYRAYVNASLLQYEEGTFRTAGLAVTNGTSLEMTNPSYVLSQGAEVETEITITKVGSLSSGVPDLASVGTVKALVQHSSNGADHDFNGAIRMGQKTALPVVDLEPIQDGPLGLVSVPGLSVVSETLRYDYGDWASIMPKAARVEKVRLVIQQLGEWNALRISYIDDQFHERFLCMTRGGTVLLDIGRSIRGLVIEVPLNLDSVSRVELAANTRHQIQVKKDSWAWVEASQGTAIVLRGERCTVTGEPEKGPFAKTVFHAGLTEELVDLIGASYAKRYLSTSMTEAQWSRRDGRPIRVYAVATNKIANGVDIWFEIQGSAELADSSVLDDNGSVAMPANYQLGSVAGLFTTGTTGTNSPRLFPVATEITEGVPDDLSPVSLRFFNPRPKKLLNGEWLINVGALADEDSFPGQNIPIPTNPIQLTAAADTGAWYILLVEEPGTSAVPNIALNLSWTSDLFEGVETVTTGNEHTYQEFWVTDYVPEDVSPVTDEEITTVLKKEGIITSRDSVIQGIFPCLAGDEIDLYTHSGCVVQLIEGREVGYKLDSIELFAATSTNSVVRDPVTIVSADGKELVDRTFLHLAETSNRGPRGTQSIFLGSPVLSIEESKYVDFDNPTVGLPSASFISASYCRANLELFVINSDTGEPVADDDVRIRWIDGVIDLVKVNRVIVLWFKSQGKVETWSTLSEEHDVQTAITPKSQILAKPGTTIVERITATGFVLLTDITDYETGLGSATRRPAESEFEIKDQKTILVSKPGRYRVRYAGASSSIDVITTGLSKLEVRTGWYRRFSDQELE